ncbi:MAG: Methionine aminopeptidase [uncultured Corynebacteriales bacterium]|uniref:Methionine aminopeptidase n=1 Tax=uncultured Mycobacteriales bacterium TaxID=581187 RepID=A0A6J4JWE7_9ACTN|nr:MAG: Methionine aminopeptidase [uncultured Corynebacteriales bacterium]
MELPIRTRTELETMREAGRVVAAALAAAAAAAVPGAKLAHLDDIARTVLHEAGASSPFLGYQPSWAPSPFNGVLCLSPNEMVVHGRPSGRRVKEGDLLSIDAGAAVDGWHGDAAVTVHVGDPRPADAALRATAEEALAAGIAAAVLGATLADVGAAIDAVVRRDGYAHLLDHGGHGIGRSMHESPFVFNEPTPDGARHRLAAGNTIAIEPMVLRGDGRYRYKRDGWAVYAADGDRAVHVEHTVAVTDDGPLILTAA